MMVGTHLEDYNVDVPELEPESVGIVATLTLTVKDREGRTKSVITKKSHSPTYNFYVLMGWLGSSGGTLTDTGGNTWSGSNTAEFTPISLSIMVGSGTSSNPLNQYNLVAPIANGTGAGQLVYSNLSVSSSPATSGSSMYFSIYIVFTNESNTTVTVSEVGLVANYALLYSSNWNHPNILLWYDTISSISLAPGDALAVTYTFTINP